MSGSLSANASSDKRLAGASLATSVETSAEVSEHSITADAWLCVHFPTLALDIALKGTQENGEAIGADRPIVVVEGKKIIQRNDVACQAGIAVGSSLATANSITAGVQSTERDTDNEQRHLRHLANIAYRFSAQVSLQPPSSVLLEINRSRRLFKGIASIVDSLDERYQRLGYTCLVATAQTPLAALALAKSGNVRRLQPRSVDTRLTETCSAADRKHHETSQEKILAEVPIHCLELSAAEIEHFTNMGLRKLGQLLQLPRSELAIRSADQLVDYLLRLSGQRPDPRRPITPVAQFNSTLNLLDPATSKADLEHPMQRLGKELHQWLKRHQYGLLQARWHFAGQSRELTGDTGHKHLPTQADLTVRFARSEQSERRLLLISHLKLEQIDLPTDVLGITLQAVQWEPWTTGADSPEQLFPELAQSNRLPSELIDQLTARLGEEALRTIANHNDYRPEHAWTQQPAIHSSRNSPERLNSSPERLRKNSPERLNSSPERLDNSPERPCTNHLGEPRGNRPLWLFQKPRPIHENSFQPLSGPERIETGWWQSGTCRDYYIARTADGAHVWVYLDASGKWFLHGYFA
ncbi:MAG: DNA polymerase Y family protein [Pseudomonadaceae bacterium]|nr:DNA polymerase Y family protein [Pseudomonadaceae bacterium]